MVEERDNSVYVVEADPEAVARAARRAKTPDLHTYRRGSDTGVLGVLGSAATWQLPLASRTHYDLGVALPLLALLIHCISLNSVRWGGISIGADFVAVITVKTDRAEPPPLEQVVNDLKKKCGIDPGSRSGPVEGTITIHVGIQRVPCKILCRFDDNSDTCCQLRLERIAE
jgi:hypothetical protein